MGDKTIKIVLMISCFLILVFSPLFFYITMHKPPSIFFVNGTYHDFGIVDEGKDVSHDFVFRNEGKKPLLIEKLVTSCGCTGADAEKRLVEPGDTSSINVTYTARRVRDKEYLAVSVFTNDPKQPFVILDLVCQVNFNVFWYPQSVSFLCKDSSVVSRKEVTFMLDQTKSISLGDISVSSRRLKAWPQWIDNNTLKCIIEVSSDCPKGTWVDKVIIEIVSDESVIQSIDIPVNIMVQ